MREPVTHLNPAFAPLSVADLQRIDFITLLAVGVVDDHHTDFLQPVRILN